LGWSEQARTSDWQLSSALGRAKHGDKYLAASVSAGEYYDRSEKRRCPGRNISVRYVLAFSISHISIAAGTRYAELTGL
jgi:hypothetical protein